MSSLVGQSLGCYCYQIVEPLGEDGSCIKPLLLPVAEGVAFKVLARQPEHFCANQDQFAAAATIVTGASDRLTPPPPPSGKKRAGWTRLLTIAAGILVLVLASAGCGATRLFGAQQAPPTPSPAAPDAAVLLETAVESPAAEPQPTALPEATPEAIPEPTADLTFVYPQEPITAANAATLAELARWGKGSALIVEYSQDGSLLAVGTPLGVYLYDAADFSQVLYIEETGYAAAMVFAPDHKTIAVCQSGMIRFWSLEDGSLFRSLDFEVNSELFALSPDGQYLAAQGKNDDIQVRRASNGELLHTLTGHSDRINSLAFSPDSRLLASVSDDETIRIWDPANPILPARRRCDKILPLFRGCAHTRKSLHLECFFYLDCMHAGLLSQLKK